MADNPDAFGGSGRAFNYCPIEDFRAFVESCPFTTLAQGHPGAFGYEVSAENIELSKQWFNEQLADMDFSKVYTVDFEIDADDMDFFICKEVDQHKTLWAKEVEEPLFAITGLEVNNKTARICGKNNDTIQITWEDNPIKYVQFKVGEGNPLYDWLSNNWDDTATIILNVIGTLELSTYEGVTSGQVNIKDLEIVK
jgi:single-stranded DNA-specific DHH superfamily exonuclease